MSKVSAYSSLTAPTSGTELYCIDSSGNSRKMKLAHAIGALSSVLGSTMSSGYILQSSGGAPKWVSPIRYVTIPLFSTATALASGPAGYITIPPDLNGYNLTYVFGTHYSSAASAGQTDIRIHNVTDNSSMLSSHIEISSAALNSTASASQALIDTAKDDVATGDLLLVNVDVVPSASAPKGLAVTLGFSLP